MDVQAPPADADREFEALAEGLPVAWAQLDASDDGEALALAYIRAAYGVGYVRGLAVRQRFGKFLFEQGEPG